MKFFQDWYHIWKGDWIGKVAIILVTFLFGAVIALFAVSIKEMTDGRRYTKRCQGVCQKNEYPILPKQVEYYPLQDCYCQKDISEIIKR